MNVESGSKKAIVCFFYTVVLPRDLMFDHMEVETNVLQTDWLMRNIDHDGHDDHVLIMAMVIKMTIIRLWMIDHLEIKSTVSKKYSFSEPIDQQNDNDDQYIREWMIDQLEIGSTVFLNDFF